MVGGSLAGVEAAVTLRGEGYGGHLTVVGKEPGTPYERYPLSKAFLTENLDATDIALPATLDTDVDHRPAAEAVDLDPRNRRVTLRGGERLPFDGLVIATGARPRLVPWASGIRGISYYRTLAEATAVRDALAEAPSSVAVVGGGLIGSEVASAVAAAGLRVTIVDRSPLPLARTVGDVVARYLAARHDAHGVRVLTRTNVVAARASDGCVRGLRLDNGEVLRADLVIVAAGTLPNTDWLGSSGLDVRDGVRCTPTLHARGSCRIVAAGDVARASYPLLDSGPARVEHWRSAMDQGRHAARSLLVGEQDALPFEGTPRYSTRIHGVAIRVVGFPQVGDECTVARGASGEDSFVAAFARRHRLVGIVAVETGDGEVAAYTALVEASGREFVEVRDLALRHLTTRSAGLP